VRPLFKVEAPSHRPTVGVTISTASTWIRINDQWRVVFRWSMTGGGRDRGLSLRAGASIVKWREYVMIIQDNRAANTLVRTSEYHCQPLPISLSYPLIFSRVKMQLEVAVSCDESRMTSPEARVRAMLNVAPWGPPFAPYEGPKASNSGRSRNEGIPEPISRFRSGTST
jgi:hypothetical protein